MISDPDTESMVEREELVFGFIDGSESALRLMELFV